ncbi:MAG: stage II sporulation protein P [Lachnospiraceae bacterium]|nr:stage II sporulation protein P [Lachnospiraceae bacterium]
MKYFRVYERSLRSFFSSVLLVFILLLIFGGTGGQKLYLPLFTYMLYENDGTSGLLGDSLTGLLPICGYAREINGTAGEVPIYEDGYLHLLAGEEEGGSLPEVWIEDETDERTSIDGRAPIDEALSDAEMGGTAALQELFEEENAQVYQYSFTPARQTTSYDWEALQDYEQLISTFYSIDANALAGSDLFNLEALRGRDVKIDRTAEGPQILIYHTHSREAFSDSEPGNPSQTIVGVGDFLTQILTEEYGYHVLHVTEEYDTVRDDAYAQSLPALEQILAENPSIQVIIDLHRDAGSASRDMVVEIDGRRTARFMFFNGISRSKKTGEISYLSNPNLAGNLALSFQMQVKAGEYYPGLTRKIYVREYRYNMHLRERSLLIELGDENNTVEEAMNACYPLAHILNMVLSGEE